MNNNGILDFDRVTGQYDMAYTRAIIQHPKYGKLYVQEEFGGGDLEGQKYRWRDGFAVKTSANSIAEISGDEMYLLRNPDEKDVVFGLVEILKELKIFGF